MKRKAFTLVEILAAVALVSIISAALYILLRSPLDVNLYSEKEFNVQSDIRLSSETINTKVKNASAAFLLTKKDKKFTKKWNYFMTEEDDDFSRIVLYEWNGTSHVKKVLSEFPKDNVVFDISFQRSKEGELLKYEIKAEDLTRNKDYNIGSEVKVLNAGNIIDESKTDYTLSPPKKRANCLAFRSDRPDPTVSNQGYNHISVSFVLDTSGSMANRIDGPKTGVRIDTLKANLKAFINTIYAQDKAGIVDVRIYPFGEYMANSNWKFRFLEPNEIQYLLDDSDVNVDYKRFFNVKKRKVVFFENMIDELYAEGATNPGDGIRLAYNGIKEYEKQIMDKKGTKKRIKHYLFVLTDGQPNYYTWAHLEEIGNKTHKLLPGLSLDDVYEASGDYKFTDSTNIDKADKRDVYYLKSPLNFKYYTGYLGLSYSVYKAVRYIQLTSNQVKNYRTRFLGEKIDVTVVGFSGNNYDLTQCNDMGKALGADPENGKYYKHCNSADALQGVFQSFSESVAASTLWFVSGPQ